MPETVTPVPRQPLLLVKTAFSHLLNEPAIFFPFAVLAGLELFLLELMYFSVREPLAGVLAPWIRAFEGEAYLHFPLNVILVDKYFRLMQMPVYLFLNSFFLGATVAVIDLINHGQPVRMRAAMGRALRSYLHLLSASFVTLGLMIGSWELYLKGARYLLLNGGADLKPLVWSLENGGPFVNLLLAVTVTTMTGFLVPAVIAGRRSIFGALLDNLRIVRRAAGPVFVMLLLPALLNVPMILLRRNMAFLQESLGPEIWLGLLAVNVFVVLFVDLLQVTALTTYYLLVKEGK